MTQLPVLVDVDSANLDTLPCCGVTNLAHEGRRQKTCWLKTNFKKGVGAKVLIAPDGKQAGYLEYMPGELAMRGVDAAGYLFIQCVFTYRRKYQHQGLARDMVQACMDTARRQGLNGVAALTREQPWMAGASLFVKCGFKPVASAPPDYQLLVRKLRPSAPDPAILRGWDKKLKRYAKGLTIIRSPQCPYVAKFADEIAASAKAEYGLTPRVVEIKTPSQAREAPTPYAIFAIIYNGRVLADHPISRTRFRNIMRKIDPNALFTSL